MATNPDQLIAALYARIQHAEIIGSVAITELARCMDPSEPAAAMPAIVKRLKIRAAEIHAAGGLGQ